MEFVSPSFSKLKYCNVAIEPIKVQVVVDVSEATTLNSGLFKGSSTYFICNSREIKNINTPGLGCSKGG